MLALWGECVAGGPSCGAREHKIHGDAGWRGFIGKGCEEMLYVLPGSTVKAKSDLIQ